MLQDVEVSVTDGALGILPEETSNIVFVMGTCSAGTANAIYAVNSTASLARLGVGPLVEAVQLLLDLSGGPCYAMPLAKGAPGTTSPVGQPTGPFGAPPVVAVRGEPYDSFDGKVLITVGGDLGVARFQLSLDGGETLTPEALTAATYPVDDTGLTLTFAPGIYNVGDVYAFTASAPSYTTADIIAAFDAALLDPREWGLVYLVGAPGGANDSAKAGACAAIIAAVGIKMRAAERRYRFARAILEAPPVVDEMSLINATANVAEPRVALVAGNAKILSALTGRVLVANIARVVVAKLARKPIGKDPSQTEPEDGTGPLPSAVIALLRDEFKTPAYDAARIVTARTYIGLTGYYLTNFPLMSARGSDYKYIQHGQVIDMACKVARNRLLRFLSKDLDLNPDGTLQEGQATAIDTAVETDERAALVERRHATAVAFRSDRTQDVQRTETIAGSVRVQSKFYPKGIKVDVGFARKTATSAQS